MFIAVFVLFCPSTGCLSFRIINSFRDHC